MKTLKKSYLINTNPEQVFKALTDEKMMAYWSESPVKMDISQNGKFSLWEGRIHGVNKYVSKSKIIQEWYEQKWKEPSIVTLNIKEKDGMTVVDLIHENIPDESFRDIDHGWDEYYMKPMIEMVELK